MRSIVAILLCASGLLAQSQHIAARAAPACGVDKVHFEVAKSGDHHPPASAEAGRALVYIVAEEMDGCDSYCPATSKVGLDGAWAGANQGNSYFYFAVDPGEHHLCATWHSKVALNKRRIALANFTAEAGKVYFFRTRVLETIEQGPHLDLDPINSDEGRFLVASYPYSSARVR
ncbi:MAG TPA: DUF2846 domain-containing protein [Candidatus Angelobacter sp.]|nr:DUF2846 domain-containing protein [Candidatus Angelobacter sp.]